MLIDLSRMLSIAACFFCVLVAMAVNAEERLAPPLEQQKKFKQKDNSAEALYVIDEARLGADGHWQKTVYVSVRVNDLDAARDYGRISIPYNHYYTTTKLNFANTLTASGEKKRVLDDAVQERITGGGQDFYSDRSELVFSLPDIAPGSILEFQFTKTSKNLPMPELYSANIIPYWFQSTAANDGWRADYVHHHQFTMTAPKNVDFVTKGYVGYKNKPKVSKKNQHIERKWVLKDTAGQKSENWYPKSDEVLPQLRLSTLSDWGAVDGWTWDKVQDKIHSTPELEKIVAELNLPDGADAEQKIKAVYDYVQTKVRYVFAHLGRGGYEPHFPNETIDARYGDCKDQTVLAVTLLRMLGVEAYPALVETPRAGKQDPFIVDLIFDHMIVFIPPQEGVLTHWLDTTGDRFLFPGMSNYLIDQNALIVNGRGGEFTQIPSAALSDNKAVLFLEYSINDENKTVVDASFHLSGYFEQNMRSWWTFDSDRENKLNQFLGVLFNSQLDYEVEGNVNNNDNIFDPVNIAATYTFKNPVEEESPSQGAGVNQILALYVDPSSLPDPATRINRFYDPYGFELEMHVKFAGPKSAIPALLQSSDGITNPYFTLEQSGKTSGDVYELLIRFTRNSLDLSVDEYADYHQKMNGLMKVAPWIVSFQPDLKNKEEQVVASAKTHFGSNSIEYKLALTKSLIKQGKFEEALVPAQEAVSIDGKNGQAWYLLATAQGLNAQFDESTLSFEKAESLGYLP